jgi:hypothetical protein
VSRKLLPSFESTFWRDAVRELVVRSGISRTLQVGLGLEFRELAARGAPIDFDSIGFNVYSETNEDGILLYVFSAIGMSNRRCVDIGAGPLAGSNVANLIVNHGFSSLLIDANPSAIAATDAYYRKHPYTRFQPPKTLTARVRPDNVDELLSEHGFSGQVDLLCLDIDGIDYWILEAISVVEPRVIVVEYQDILGPDRSWTVPNRPDFDGHQYPVNRTLNNYSGASLAAFDKLTARRGYKLVGTNRGGWNAVFVKQGLCDAALPAVSVQSCFRYEWNQIGMATRFPLVKDMEWTEV